MQKSDIRKAVFDPTNPMLGLQYVSLVADPAIQIELIQFSNELNVSLTIQDEEKMRFVTPVLIPNQLVPRKDPKTGEVFHLVFDAETIKQVAYDWQKKNMSRKVDMNHSRKLIEGVTFVETFLTNEKTINSVKGFEALPHGTWYLVGEGDNAESWKPIKDRVIKGVSIDGIFQTEQLSVSLSEDNLKAIVKKIFTTQN